MAKNKHAQEMNRLRNKSLSKKRRVEIAKNAINTRWAKKALDKNDIHKQNINDTCVSKTDMIDLQ